MYMLVLCQPLAIKPPSPASRAGVVVNVDGLRVVAPGVVDDLFGGHFVTAELEFFPDGDVFQITHG